MQGDDCAMRKFWKRDEPGERKSCLKTAAERGGAVPEKTSANCGCWMFQRRASVC